MKVSTRGRYAIRIMLDLAVNSTGEFIPLKDISRRQEITIKYMEQIVNMLVKAGCVKSVRGSGGGYQLSKQPSEYTMGEILRVTEGPLAPVACLEEERNQCPRADECATLMFWRGLQDKVNEYVDHVTLQDLVEHYHHGCSEFS